MSFYDDKHLWKRNKTQYYFCLVESYLEEMKENERIRLKKLKQKRKKKSQNIGKWYAS